MPTASPTKAPSYTTFTPPGFITAHADSAGGLQVTATGTRFLLNQWVESEPAVGIDCGQWLALATDRLTYSADEMRAIDAYLGPFGSQDLAGGEYEDPSALPTLPSTLQLAAGFPQCGSYFQIANTGTTTVQIDGIGVRYDTNPVPNTYPYRLLDACPLIAHSDGTCGEVGGAASECFYIVHLGLGPGGAGTAYRAPVTEDVSDPVQCPLPLNLAPGQDVTITLDITPPSSSPATIFHVTPYLLIGPQDNVQRPLLSKLAGTLAFTSGAKLPCYVAQGSTFTALSGSDLQNAWETPDDYNGPDGRVDFPTHACV